LEGGKLVCLNQGGVYEMREKKDEERDTKDSTMGVSRMIQTRKRKTYHPNPEGSADRRSPGKNNFLPTEKQKKKTFDLAFSGEGDFRRTKTILGGKNGPTQ